MSNPNSELHGIACYTHGILTGIHSIGVVYNVRRKNWWDVLAHTLALAYSLRSTAHHMKLTKVRREQQLVTTAPEPQSSHGCKVCEGPVCIHLENLKKANERDD